MSAHNAVAPSVTWLVVANVDTGPNVGKAACKMPKTTRDVTDGKWRVGRLILGSFSEAARELMRESKLKDIQEHVVGKNIEGGDSGGSSQIA